jgi:hypothetical protein
MQDASFNLQRDFKILERETHDLRHRETILEARVEQMSLELDRKDATIKRLQSELSLAPPVVPPSPPPL